jgi:hypothetical protein
MFMDIVMYGWLWYDVCEVENIGTRKHVWIVTY